MMSMHIMRLFESQTKFKPCRHDAAHVRAAPDSGQSVFNKVTMPAMAFKALGELHWVASRRRKHD